MEVFALYQLQVAILSEYMVVVVEVLLPYCKVFKGDGFLNKIKKSLPFRPFIQPKVLKTIQLANLHDLPDVIPILIG